MKRLNGFAELMALIVLAFMHAQQRAHGASSSFT
jgi:hypothetical protein